MGTVAGVTGQLNSMGGCTPANCCAQVDGLAARIAALESKAGIAGQALQTANEAKNKAFSLDLSFAGISSTVNGLESKLGLLGLVVGGASSRAAAAMATDRKSVV